MITLRRAMPEDEGKLFPLARDFATSFSVDPSAFAQSFLKIQNSEGALLAVAEHRGLGVPVGYLLGTAHPSFYANGNVAWVEEIMVGTDFRRQGIGRLLMDYFEAWAQLKECRLVALATRRASDFYLALGYSESATYFRKVLVPEA